MKRKSIYRMLSLILVMAIALLWLPMASYAAVGNTGSEAELRARVLEDETGDVVLSTHIGDLATQLTIARSLTLDLNGYTLSIILAAETGNDTNGIKIDEGMTLTVKDSVGSGILNVINRASAATVGNGAAINVTDATLAIQSGTVTATGGIGGAGIGGGNQEAGGVILVSGGSVTAQGGGGSAGIGGGAGGDGGNITVNGGSVTGRGGPNGGAGIGGGYRGAGGRITINSGAVTAAGGYSGAGIGGGGTISSDGNAGTGGNITINGGTVNATGGNAALGGAAIGGGGGYGSTGGAGGVITISGGTVNATGGSANYGGAGIGGGSSGAGGTISITGGTVTAQGGGGAGYSNGGTGIGCGFGGAGSTISIGGGTVAARGGNYNVGIGGSGSFIIISGGAVTVPGTSNSTAAIGGSTINVTGTYDYWVNTTNTEPEEQTGTGTFTIDNPFPYIGTYRYVKLVSGDGPPIVPPIDPPLVYAGGDVLGKIVGDGQTKISVDIKWGDMKFVYDTGGRTWDPSTHTYIGGSGVESWLVDNAAENSGIANEWYLERGNNRIVVTNHSNRAIDALFNYDMLTGAAFDDLYSAGIAGDATAFNADGANRDAVVGGFYGSEESAKAGARVLTAPRANADYNTLPDGKISLPTAEGRPFDSEDIIGRVYFAFSGTPDAGRNVVLPSFKKVGVITVTIVPR